ncbi:lipopolysaccharide export system permease protein [Rhodovulum iodosum]|uniref:Lipopolysaccharide export system permease protein n=1 Tax=Rhodovulum iodosum TaxID=68291 RepID=A0ABV3XV20_9RHOB|nr:LPS export ABC transporter permease LptG [Rhodovulum robiginosum]RSK33632.1 LPS export ABC transporter permease LptG [Rhodovulum robiginosum]
MTLHLYFARKFALAVLSLLALFSIFLLLIDMVEQIRNYDIGEITLTGAFHLAALNVPSSVYGILPLIVALATLVLFLGLARTSELVVTRAAGRSALRSLAAPVITALLFGVVTVAVLNPIVAGTRTAYDQLSARQSQSAQSVLSISDEGLWLRQGTPEGQMVIRAARANFDGTRLYDVTFLAFGPDGSPDFRIAATSAELTSGAWELRRAKRWDLGAGTDNPERDATVYPQFRLDSDLTRERIRDSFGTPSAIPIWELPEFIDDLEHAGFSARQHRVWLQMELSLPLLFAAMVLIGAGFTMRHIRFGRTGTMVMLALGLALALYFLRNFAQVLGENGQIPVPLAAWAPPVAGIFFALGLLLHLEDG